ncbi:MAG: hypothetical protein ABSA76_01220 [Bacteroidales bacterium]|jgi:hypothetical protein
MKKGVEVKGVFIAETRYELLQNVVNHLIEGQYISKSGLKIEDDESFKSLQKTAEDQVKTPYFVFYYKKRPDVGLLKIGLLDNMNAFYNNFPPIVKWMYRMYMKRITISIRKIEAIEKRILPKIKELSELKRQMEDKKGKENESV